MNFKDAVALDINNVFLNVDEFGERRNIRYDGAEYPDVPIVLEGPEEIRRERLTGDHVPGLHSVTAILHMAVADLGGLTPKQGARIDISTREGGRFFERYHVAVSENQAGMLRLELEAIGQ